MGTFLCLAMPLHVIAVVEVRQYQNCMHGEHVQALMYQIAREKCMYAFFCMLSFAPPSRVLLVNWEKGFVIEKKCSCLSKTNIIRGMDPEKDTS